MKVLMISGDARIFQAGTEARERFLLQKAQVPDLVAVVWGMRAPFSFIYILILSVSRRFDVVTTQDPFWRGLLGVVAARLSGARLQVQVHADLSPLSRGGFFMGIRRRLVESVLRRANSIRAVSEKTKAQAEALGADCYVDVLPVFIDIERVTRAQPADLKRAYPQFGHLVLFVGRLEAEKAPGEALKAFAEVVREFPGAGLLVAGEGQLRTSLEAQARNLGLAQKVIFLGYRADLPSLYKSVDCLLVSSPYESYGAAMVEALAAGCPVVSPDVGVADEAGAIVVPRHQLGAAATQAIRASARGALRLPVLSKPDWAQKWRETLQ